jgi:hypothetical protein
MAGNWSYDIEPRPQPSLRSVGDPRPASALRFTHKSAKESLQNRTAARLPQS